MNIRYLGPSPMVNIGGFGVHEQGQVVDYPDAVARELLETGKRQQFELVVDDHNHDAPPLTAEQAIALIKASVEVTALDAMLAGETRKTVLIAIDKRRTELTAANG